MTSKFLSLSVALAASIVALQAAAQTPLPANLQADRATIQQDQTLVQSIVQQHRTDEAAGNSAAVAADRTALRLAHMKTGQDFGQLHQDAQPLLQPGQAVLTNALTQLYTDQHTNNVSAVQADQAAVAAAEMAISSPLLEASIDGAHGVLLSIQGGSDLGLFEINEAAQLVSNSAAVDANIIFGAVIDDALGDEVRVTVIAAGFDGGQPKTLAPSSPAAAAIPSAASGAGSGLGGDVSEHRGSGQGASAPAAAAPIDPDRDLHLPTERKKPRTIVFDDSSVDDDLDVPDFLK